MLAVGGVIAFGSDWSVSSMNPLDGIEVAVTHREPAARARARRGCRRSRSRCRTRSRATRSAARTSTSREKETGSIEVGKAADLIVLDRNLFEIPPSQIHEAKVLSTLLEGKEVYRAKGY